MKFKINLTKISNPNIYHNKWFTYKEYEKDVPYNSSWVAIWKKEYNAYHLFRGNIPINPDVNYSLNEIKTYLKDNWRQLTDEEVIKNSYVQNKNN